MVRRMIWMPNREPPLDPPEPELAFFCEGCGNEIYVGDTYYRVDGKNYCEDCVSQEIAEYDDNDDGPDPDIAYDRWRDSQLEKEWGNEQ